jgi:uncharacterized protein (DUF2267 family)
MSAAGESKGNLFGRPAMSQTGVAAFDKTLHATNEWLKELMEGLGYTDRQKAYHALREVLHALRDRLPVDAVAALGAQLPLLVRGVYYEGWHPGDKPFKQHHDQFLGRVAESLRDREKAHAEAVVRAVFHVLARHVSSGEIESVKHALPWDLRPFWSY